MSLRFFEESQRYLLKQHRLQEILELREIECTTPSKIGLGVSPNHLNVIKLTMELWKEYHARLNTWRRLINDILQPAYRVAEIITL